MSTMEQKPANSAIGERLLTLNDAAEVLRLSTRTVREYVKGGEISGIIGKRWRRQILTLSLKTHPLIGIFMETTTTGIRRWRGENADRMAAFLDSGRGSTAKKCPSSPAWIVRAHLDDPREIPYLLIWRRERDGEIA